MIEIKLSWDPDHDQAVANTRFWAALALTAEQKHGTSDPLEMEKLGDELSDEQVASRWIVSADPDEVVAKVKQYVDWGFDHLVFHGPGHDQSRFLTTFVAAGAPGTARARLTATTPSGTAGTGVLQMTTSARSHGRSAARNGPSCAIHSSQNATASARSRPRTMSRSMPRR